VADRPGSRRFDVRELVDELGVVGLAVLAVVDATMAGSGRTTEGRWSRADLSVPSTGADWFL
jgi:hypothetical protein